MLLLLPPDLLCTAGKTKSVELDKYVPSMLEMVGYSQETLYMIPFYNYTMLLFYREDMMKDPQLQKDFRKKYGRNMKVPNNLKDSYIQN